MVRRTVSGCNDGGGDTIIFNFGSNTHLLFQIIDTLLGGGKQKGCRPLEYVGDQLVRRQLGLALRDLSPSDKLDLFPAPGLGRWGRVGPAAELL